MITNARKTLGYASVAVLACGLGLGLAHAKDVQTDIGALKRAEQVWVESLQTGDAKRLATIIDDKFLFIGPDGERETREAYLAGYEAMPKMGVVVERIDMDEVDVRVLGEVGIVTGHVIARVKMQGALIQENVRFTRVYRRAPQGWRMVVGQGTRIAPAAPGKG
jgi:ketosteroid isomerase-like protein